MNIASWLDGIFVTMGKSLVCVRCREEDARTRAGALRCAGCQDQFEREEALLDAEEKELH